MLWIYIWSSTTKKPHPVSGYLNLQDGVGGCHGWPDIMLTTLLFLCAADQRNCCDNCVSSVYQWNRPLIILYYFLYFYWCITECCQLLRKWNIKLAVMFLVDEWAWETPCRTPLSLFGSHSCRILNTERIIY